MNAATIIDRLDRFPGALRGAVACVTEAQARFRPPSGAWSILEVVNHLVDEERDDFRARLRQTLEQPQPAWPPIDPEGWARQRRYNERALAESVAVFVQERRTSVEWLRSLPSTTDWSRAYQHPRFGPIHAGDLLAAWAAHDALHLRQIAKRLYELAGCDGEPFSARYAGEWGP